MEVVLHHRLRHLQLIVEIWYVMVLIIAEIALEIVVLVAQQLVVEQVVALAEVDIVVGGKYVLGEGAVLQSIHMCVTGFVVRVPV